MQEIKHVKHFLIHCRGSELKELTVYYSLIFVIWGELSGSNCVRKVNNVLRPL